MPCRDGGPSQEQIREEQVVEASLCALMTVLETGGALENAIARCNWREAGVHPDELRGWWAKHKRKDATRREVERAAQERERLREQALSKLTPEERLALRNRR